ncbi:11488_t:CDS:2 [Entrophospora sp. SA101]|nr:11488_t:CDS:2 [Entrophospora sp. SA101]
MEVTLRVTDNYEPDQYLLVEFTDEIDDIFEKARLNSEELPKLCIKAQSLDEEPVFCTPDKTFSIKKKEYTDSMCLFVPQPVKKHEGSKMDIDEDFNIVSVESNNNTDFSRKSELLHKREEILMKRPEFILEMVEKRKFVVELIQQPPELEVLNKLLKPTTYTGPENEEHIKKKYKLYTLDELDGIIKASVGEILCTFERKYALEIDGYWRYVDLEYLLQLYEAINLQAGIYLGNFEVIKLSEISKIISDYGFPDFLIRHCLSMLSESKCENELGLVLVLIIQCSVDNGGGNINSYGDKTADQNNEMALKILKGHIVKYFWEEIVLKSKLDCNDCNSLSFIVKGIRNNIASELMEHGNIILKKCKQLVPDIKELFRSLLLSIDDDEKMKFCDSLLTQVTAIKNEKNDEDFLACLMPRIKLFVLVIHILTARVAATSTQEACQKMKEYKLIEKWTILLLSLLCDDRVHRNGHYFNLVTISGSYSSAQNPNLLRNVINSNVYKGAFPLPACS